MADLLIEDVTKIFRDGTEAVRSFTLDVADGSLCVVVGPSGCGKTTLLRLIAGLDDVTDGRIVLDGEDVTEETPRSRDVAMVFQNYALYPHLNVYENVAFGLRSRRVKKADVDQRVRLVARVLGLEDVLKKRPAKLSGGQRQRVAMGRAIVRRPRAFLLDEPLSNLDVRLRAEMRAEISRLQREFGVTTLYVTHDQAEAMMLGDRVAVMRAGTLQQVDSPRAIYERPRNLFVAGFVGSPPMNLAEATVEEADGRVYLRFGGHRLGVDGETLAHRARVRSFVWRQVVVGIRPEDLALADDAAPEDRRLRMEVRRREDSGADVFLHFVVDAPLLLDRDPRDPEVDEAENGSGGRWAAERTNVFLARLGATGAKPGDVVELSVQAGAIHLFDPKTGEAIED
jgi:multiple sugar transport system ATP-binding protein